MQFGLAMQVISVPLSRDGCLQAVASVCEAVFTIRKANPRNGWAAVDSLRVSICVDTTVFRDAQRGPRLGVTEFFCREHPPAQRPFPRWPGSTACKGYGGAGGGQSPVVDADVL